MRHIIAELLLNADITLAETSYILNLSVNELNEILDTLENKDNNL